MWREIIYRLARPIDRMMSVRVGGVMLAEGSVAPDFSLLAHDGQTVALKGLRGKTVILWFFPKADTPGWTLEGNGFRDRIQKFNEKNAVVLGISFDTIEENRKFAEKFSFPFSLLCDTERRMGILYGACKSKEDAHASRIGYIIDPKGMVKRAYAKVDARSFPETALQEV